jgi:hypothetical protein
MMQRVQNQVVVPVGSIEGFDKKIVDSWQPTRQPFDVLSCTVDRWLLLSTPVNKSNLETITNFFTWGPTRIMNRNVASEEDGATTGSLRPTHHVPIVNPLSQGNKTAQRTLPRPPCPSQPTQYAEAMMNMSLFDPPRWGWTAIGGITDVLPPQEVNWSFFIGLLSFISSDDDAHSFSFLSDSLFHVF